MDRLGRWIKAPFVVLGAVIFLIEEVTWDAVTALGAWLGRLPLIARIEATIRRLPPYPSMLLLGVPFACVLPIKLIALYFIGQGHVVAGVAAIVAAKLVGTAVVARLFALTRDKLLTIAWFAALYGWVMRTKARIHGYLEALPLWQATTRAVRRLRDWVRATLGIRSPRQS